VASIGVFTFPTEYSIPPGELAAAVEERGLTAFFVAEHTHIPTSRLTPSPSGQPLPKEYLHTLDPFVALTAAAMVTERIRLGTGICLVAQHEPIALAKTIASLDVISHGRVDLAIGGGWNKEELANHGIAFADRWKVTREHVLAMRALWTDGEAEFHGEFVNFDSSWSWPKPVQAGGPPILLGAVSAWAPARVVDYCDGWFPNARTGNLVELLQQLRTAADAAGRAPDQFKLTAFAAPPEVEPLRSLFAMGFQRALLPVPSEPADVVLPLLDRYAELARRLA
jgi:probable F420-dependent oxidoreductase